MPKNAPTSTDVAREAGVSRATVSYVLNGRSDVRITDATREQVLSAARRLGYQPSPAARALRVGRGDVVLFLLPDWDTTGELGHFLESVGNLTSEAGFVCLRYEGPQWQGHLAALLGKVTAAAVVTFSPLSARDAEAMAASTIPEVRAWLLDGPEGHTLRIDQREVVQLQVDRLVSRGYHSLIYAVIKDPRNQQFIDARVSAFKDLVAAQGITDTDVVVLAGRLDEFVDVVRSMRDTHGSPIGVCAWNDMTAAGILSAAHILGLAVPDQIGVIGVDDTPLAALTAPPLSSIRFDLTQDAALIAATVASTVGVPHEWPAVASDPVTLVTRASC
ncbi:LacI family DNA-binding transcriptional regulator [Nocardioides sp.]|uniref:LacI family DNA-binding transcriptional regulator n=1 Tax=Nocardioides sp. TaxID=35761 RepID=UPI003783F87C